MSETILDLDSILDSTLDAVKDVPDYCNPPTGNYTLSIPSAELKAGLPAKDGKPATAPRLVITYKVEQTIETEGSPVADGTLFTEGFQANEQGLEYFKKQSKKLLNAESIDGISIRDLLGALPELPPFSAVLTTTKNKEGYENVRIRPVYEA